MTRISLRGRFRRRDVSNRQPAGPCAHIFCDDERGFAGISQDTGGEDSLWVTAVLATSLLLGRWVLDFSASRSMKCASLAGCSWRHAAWEMLNNESRMTLDEHYALPIRPYRADAHGDADPGPTRLNESGRRHVNLRKHMDELWRLPIRIRLKSG